jgi:hypothetical protein
MIWFADQMKIRPSILTDFDAIFEFYDLAVAYQKN